MGTNRRPKGSYVRPTPDWYILEGASAGAIVNVTSPPVPAIDLFNNSTDGTFLHVYEVWVGAQNYGPYAIVAVNGHASTFIANAKPIVVGTAQPWGALYWGSLTADATWVSGTPANGFNYGSDYATDNPDGTVDRWRSSGPIKVLPPGYSLRVWYPINFGSGTVGTISASFRYIQVHDRG